MVTGVYCRACPDLQTWGHEASFTHAFTVCRNPPQQFLAGQRHTARARTERL